MEWFSEANINYQNLKKENIKIFVLIEGKKKKEKKSRLEMLYKLESNII